MLDQNSVHRGICVQLADLGNQVCLGPACVDLVAAAVDPSLLTPRALHPHVGLARGILRCHEHIEARSNTTGEKGIDALLYARSDNLGQGEAI